MNPCGDEDNVVAYLGFHFAGLVRAWNSRGQTLIAVEGKDNIHGNRINNNNLLQAFGSLHLRRSFRNLRFCNRDNNSHFNDRTMLHFHDRNLLGNVLNPRFLFAAVPLAESGARDIQSVACQYLSKKSYPCQLGNLLRNLAERFNASLSEELSVCRPTFLCCQYQALGNDCMNPCDSRGVRSAIRRLLARNASVATDFVPEETTVNLTADNRISLRNGYTEINADMVRFNLEPKQYALSLAHIIQQQVVHSDLAAYRSSFLIPLDGLACIEPGDDGHLAFIGFALSKNSRGGDQPLMSGSISILAGKDITDLIPGQGIIPNGQALVVVDVVDTAHRRQIIAQPDSFTINLQSCSTAEEVTSMLDAIHIIRRIREVFGVNPLTPDQIISDNIVTQVNGTLSTQSLFTSVPSVDGSAYRWLVEINNLLDLGLFETQILKRSSLRNCCC